MATLTLQLPSLPPVEHVLKDEAVTIGRMKGNTIALDDVSVSLSHAKLTLRDGGYFLKDLNSTNGTMVNGQSVTEVRLHDGDQVKFGDVIGHYHAGAAPLPSTPISQATPATAGLVSHLPRAGFKEPVAKSSPWFGLVVKILGLGVAGLLMWKLVLNPKPAPPAMPEPAPLISTAKPATPAPPQTDVAAQVPPPAPVVVPPSERIPALVKSLKSPEVRERRQAVAALNAMQAEALPAAPALREALKDSDAEVRTWAALSLVSNRVYDKASVPILIQVLHHENPTLRQVACLSLALIPFNETEKEPVIAALTECMSNDTNADVRTAALSALKMVAHDSTPVGK